MLTAKRTSLFKKDFRRSMARGKNPKKFYEVASLLVEGEILPEKFRDHKLTGNFSGCRECHLEPDWLMIYRILDDSIIFERTGTHSDLFKK